LLFYTDETVKVASALANGMKIPIGKIKKKGKSQDKQHCSTLRDTITMKMTNLQANSTQP